MSRLSDSERERAASSLRRQYLNGRLTTDELADRLELALVASRRRDLRRAFAELPSPWRDLDEVRRLGRHVKRTAVRALVTAAWASVTLMLLVSFALNAIDHGVTMLGVLAFALPWLIVSVLAWQARRRA